MTYNSVFDLFKVGLGPSSSHTVGPMRAAAMFIEELAALGLLLQTEQVTVDLYGSLALTGRGHGTDHAVLVGLEGLKPEEALPENVEHRVRRIREHSVLRLRDIQEVYFLEDCHIIWHKSVWLQRHSNALRIRAIGAGHLRILERVYYSVGGGFVESEGAAEEIAPIVLCPYPFVSAAELVALANAQQLAIWEVALANESSLRFPEEVLRYIEHILEVMRLCIAHGFATGGILPGWA